MTLSITQRLALTVAVLAGLVIAPVCSMFYLALVHNMETSALDQAHAVALEIEHTIWTQLDEDILFDFAGQRVAFDKLNIPMSDWALLRGDGRIETAQGIFKQGPVLLPGEFGRELCVLANHRFAIGAVPLKPERPLTWTDMPEVVRQTIMNRVPGTVFLWAKSDVLDQHNIFDVQMLGEQQITNLSVTEQGECVKVMVDPLVDSLPTGMDTALTQGHGIMEHRITGWHAYQGELIAVIEGMDLHGSMIRLGVNRFGQEYELNEKGVPVASQEPSRFYVVAALDIRQEEAKTALWGRGILVGGIGVWGLMVLVAWLVTKRALHPVHDMVQQADRIIPSKLHERLPVRPVTDELSRVARTVNRMLDRLQQGYQRERQFTGDVSHEMRNPLAKMIAEIDWALSRERDVGEYQEILMRLRGYSQGMQQLVDSLLMLARLDSGFQDLDIHPFDVTALVIETLKTFSKESASRVQVELGPSVNPMMAIGHESLISVLIGNLLDNALRYSPAHSPVFLRIHRRAKTIHFSIEDRGLGIPENQRALVFNRFHRLDKSRSKTTGGAGLGLAIVQAIAEVHHITVDIASGAEGGTVVSFALPARHD
jgi:heavy metal sensor kinase